VDVQFRRPVGEGDRLDRVPLPVAREEAGDLTAIATAVNANADKLNARLFSSMDYIVVGRK
jgi:hypothetical protein